MDVDKLNEWMGVLLRNRGADIFRMKGVIAIKGRPRKFVFQGRLALCLAPPRLTPPGVHMLFDGNGGAAWGETEARISKLVFIGKGLNREELHQGFTACLVQA